MGDREARPEGSDVKVIVGIQARLGSSRLPGKVLADICGKPMIQRVWEACSGPWRRMVLTTLKPEDDELCDFLKSQDMEYRRGSEPDVLSRYAEVASGLRPNCLIRVCADAPFLEARWIDAAVKANRSVFVPKALHGGSWIAWDEANRNAQPKDWEHAGYYWFQEHATTLDLVDDPEYFTVNAAGDLERARALLGKS